MKNKTKTKINSYVLGAGYTAKGYGTVGGLFGILTLSKIKGPPKEIGEVVTAKQQLDPHTCIYFSTPESLRTLSRELIEMAVEIENNKKVLNVSVSKPARRSNKQRKIPTKGKR